MPNLNEDYKRLAVKYRVNSKEMIKEAIQLAIEKGGYAPFGTEYYHLKSVQPWGPIWKADDQDTEEKTNEECFLDPLFWQALGKALNGKVGDTRIRNGFGETISRETNDRWWKETWHHFIDHLAEGKSAESFFEELLSEKR